MMLESAWRRGLLLALVALVAALVSCKEDKPGGEPAGEGKGEVSTPAGAKKVIHMAIAGDPETLDVGKMSGEPEGRVAFNIFEGLWMPAQETGAPVNGVAESSKVGEDGKTWTITLRKDAKWSNGDPVTAHDYVYAWKRVMTPGFDADYAEFMDFIKGGAAYRKGEEKDFANVGLKAVDDHTLQVELTNPTPFFTELLAFYTYFPVHKASVEKHGDQWTRAENLVSNGPYRMKEYQHQQYILLEKNPHYWDKDKVKIDEIKIFVIKDNTAQLNAFQEKKIDMMDGGIPVGKVPALKGKPEFRIDPMLGTYYYRVNVTHEALGKKEVRQALALAVDRKSLTELTMKGLYAPATGFVPPMPGYESPTTLEYNPEKARELLKQAGYPDGQGLPEITLLFNTDQNHKLIAEIIQDTWKRELKVEVKLENKEWKTYLGDIDKLSYQVARAGWIGDYNDPTTFLGIFTCGNGNNDTGWCNPAFDEKIKAAYATAAPEERKALLVEAERMMMDELPIIPIYFYTIPNLISTRVIGHKPQNRDVHLVRYMDLK